MNEKISALLDGELDRAEQGEVLDQLGQDTAEAVHRYQLIGALMRNECTDAALGGRSVADRIASSIDTESHWNLSVGAKPVVEKAADSMPDNVVRLPSNKPAFIGGFAMAAAISALAIFVGGPQWLGTQTAVEPVVASTTSANQWKNSEASHEDSLNAFLVNHGEFTGSAGLNGLMAYAKFVSYQSDQ